MLILCNAGSLKVLGTVKLKNEFCPITVEVHNVMSNGFLSVKWNIQKFKEVIPEMTLLFCHFLAKFA